MSANWSKRLEKQWSLLEEAPLSASNKQAIRWFIEHYKPVSDNRKDKYIRYLKQMAVLLGKSFSEMDKDDVGRLVQELERRFPEEWTFLDCKTMFKTFFRFYMDDLADKPQCQDEYLRLAPVLKAVGKIETRYRRHKQKKLLILTKEEIRKLFQAASNTVRELAMITFLYHTAARPSEFVNMTVGDVEINADGTIYFTVAGKTGSRRLPLEADEMASRVLLDWLNVHPQGSHKDALLWLNNAGKPLTVSALGCTVWRLSKRAGVRLVTAKLFRKAKLSHMADDGYNAYQIKKYAGHSQVETAMFYVELSQKGFEETIRKRYGSEAKQQALLQPKKCWGCGLVSRSFDTRCRGCGKLLDVEAAMQEVEQRSDLIASVMPQDMIERLAELVAEKLRMPPGAQPAAVREELILQGNGNGNVTARGALPRQPA